MTFQINFEKKGDITAAEFEVDINMRNLPDGKWTIVCKKQTRTLPQNNSYHKFAEIASNQCISENKPMSTKFCGMDIGYYPSPEQIKENIFKPFMIKQYGKNSSAKLTTKEMSEFSEIMERAFSMNGMDVEFPCEENKTK